MMTSASAELPVFSKAFVKRKTLKKCHIYRNSKYPLYPIIKLKHIISKKIYGTIKNIQGTIKIKPIYPFSKYLNIACLSIYFYNKIKDNKVLFKTSENHNR